MSKEKVLNELRGPVAEAVLPVKVDAIRKAEQEALKRVEDVRAKLAEAGNDLKKAAPYPRDTWNIGEMVRYQLFHSICKYRESVHTLGDPRLADVDAKMVRRFVDNAKKTAADQYDAFVWKLVLKVGEVEKAELSGNHVWSHSILTVTKKDGTVERWKTQTITNWSKLGKYFPQWPTRRMK